MADCGVTYTVKAKKFLVDIKLTENGKNKFVKQDFSQTLKSKIQAPRGTVYVDEKIKTTPEIKIKSNVFPYLPFSSWLTGVTGTIEITLQLEFHIVLYSKPIYPICYIGQITDAEVEIWLEAWEPNANLYADLYNETFDFDDSKPFWKNCDNWDEFCEGEEEVEININRKRVTIQPDIGILLSVQAEPEIEYTVYTKNLALVDYYKSGKDRLLASKKYGKKILAVKTRLSKSKKRRRLVMLKTTKKGTKTW